MTKYDNIMSHVKKIEIHLASIEGHLKELNGNVSRHEKLIETNRIETNNKIKYLNEENLDQNKMIWKTAGVVGLLATLLTFLLNYVLN